MPRPNVGKNINVANSPACGGKHARKHECDR